MGLELEIRLEKDSYAPGEEVRGTIDVLEGDTARYVQVAISQVEVTSDYTDVVRSLSMGAVHTGDLATGMSIPFSAPLPPDARPNVLGIGSILWRIEANVDRRGFNKSLAWPIPLVVPPPSKPLRPSAGSGPALAGGVEYKREPGSLIAVFAIIALIGAAAFFGALKWLSFDDPRLPEASALQAELEQRFGDASWFGSITSVEGDSPDPGDMSIDTNLAHDEAGSATVEQMCAPLIDYLAEKDIEGTTIFIHSTDEDFVQGQVIIFGTDWTCEEDGVDDF